MRQRTVEQYAECRALRADFQTSSSRSMRIVCAM
jgi:hypothetical protein